MYQKSRKIVRSTKTINGRQYVQYIMTLPKDFGDRLLTDEVKILQHDSFLIIIPSTLSIRAALELVLREVMAELRKVVIA